MYATLSEKKHDPTTYTITNLHPQAHVTRDDAGNLRLTLSTSSGPIELTMTLVQAASIGAALIDKSISSILWGLHDVRDVTRSHERTDRNAITLVIALLERLGIRPR